MVLFICVPGFVIIFHSQSMLSFKRVSDKLYPCLTSGFLEISSEILPLIYMCVCVCGVICAFHRLYKVDWTAEFMEDVPQVTAICFIKCFSKLIKAVCVSKLKSRRFPIICCAMNILIIVQFPFPNPSCSSRITASVIVLSVLLILLYILYALFSSLNAPIAHTSPSMRYRACYPAGIEDNMQSSNKG
jgi:phosphatidylserine synthase